MKFIIIFYIIFHRSLGESITIDSLTVNEQLNKLAAEVIDKYYVSSQCVIVIAEHELLRDLRTEYANTFMHISTDDLCSDIIAHDIIVEAFIQNCNGYVVQISRPTCFMKVWTDALFKTIQRPNPRIFFLPVVNDNSSVNIASDIYSMRETEITEKILVAEYETENEDWPIKLYTNNFIVPVGTSGRIGEIFLDRWSYENSFENSKDLYPDKIENMQGKKVRLMTFDYVPYSHKDPMDGFEVRIVIEFCHVYNCTVELVDDGFFWGSIYTNGTGDGINGLVYTDKADFGLAANYLWIEEFFYIDYSHTYLQAAVTLLVPKEVPLSGWRVPFLPFDLSMWCTYGLSIVVASIFMYIVTRATLRFTRFSEAVKKKKQFTSIADSALRIVGMSVLQQPSIPLVPHTPIRHLFTSFEILYLVLTTCYSAELASYLTVPQFTKPINTFHELAESGLIWIAYHEAYINALQFVDDHDVQKVASNFRKIEGEELVKHTATGKYGTPLERCPSGYFSEHEHISEQVIDKSHVMAENVFGSPLVTVIRKASPYKEKFDKLIRMELEGGLIICWEGKAARMFLSSRKQMAMQQSRATNTKQMPMDLNLSHVQGTFMIYASGITLGFISFIAEYYHGRKKIKQKL